MALPNRAVSSTASMKVAAKVAVAIAVEMLEAVAMAAMGVSHYSKCVQPS